MPTYEFRCNSCKRKVSLTYKTYAAYDEAVHTCPRCGSTDLTRLISRVALKRPSLARLMSGDTADDSALDNIDDSDPRLLGRMLREMSEETGEGLGDEFEDVVNRLERGENPEDIEASLPGDEGEGLGGDTTGLGLPAGGDDEW